MNLDGAKAKPGQINLQPGRTAFLIIHGVGQQNKFETLSRFAAGLKIGIEDALPGSKTAVHRKLIKLEGHTETCLSIKVPAISSGKHAAEIDVYEYYYQPILQRQVSVEDVVGWLLKAAKRIRKLYEQDSYLQGRLGHARQNSAGTGDRLENGYMLVPAARFLPFIIAGTSWLINVLKGISATKWPIGPFRFLVNFLIKFSYDFIANKLDTLITEFAGDVTAYTAINPKSRLHNLRTEILTGCTRKILGLLNMPVTKSSKSKSPFYDRLIVAGHSLGSVVAYDALSWISNDIATGLCSFPGQGEQRLTGLVTFGSPLDKIALFFWPLSEEQMQKEKTQRDHTRPATKDDYADRSAEFQVGMLDYFHGMRGMRESVANYPSEVVQPLDRPLRHVAWLNFFHPRDAIAGHLDAYAGVKNLCRFGESENDPPFPESHSYYWYDPGLYDSLIQGFVAVEGIQQGDRQEKILEKLVAIERAYDRRI